MGVRVHHASVVTLTRAFYAPNQPRRPQTNPTRCMGLNLEDILCVHLGPLFSCWSGLLLRLPHAVHRMPRCTIRLSLPPRMRRLHLARLVIPNHHRPLHHPLHHPLHQPTNKPDILMDISFIPVTHGVLALVAGTLLFVHRARHMALVLLAFAIVDAVFIRGTASWQAEHALSFVGPIGGLTAVALTVGAPIGWTLALAAPAVITSALCLSHGLQLGSHGLAWSLAAAHLYAAAAGFQLLRIGARQLPRLHASIAGLFVAASGPGVVGWSLLALGHSMRSAAALDCVFLSVIVIASFVEWIRKWLTTYSAQSQAHCSGRGSAT